MACQFLRRCRHHSLTPKAPLTIADTPPLCFGKSTTEAAAIQGIIAKWLEVAVASVAPAPYSRSLLGLGRMYMLESVQLGNSGLSVSRLCLGTMNFGEPGRGHQGDWTLTLDESRPIFKAALDNGLFYFDCANV